MEFALQKQAAQVLLTEGFNRMHVKPLGTPRRGLWCPSLSWLASGHVLPHRLSLSHVRWTIAFGFISCKWGELQTTASSKGALSWAWTAWDTKESAALISWEVPECYLTSAMHRWPLSMLRRSIFSFYQNSKTHEAAASSLVIWLWKMKQERQERAAASVELPQHCSVCVTAMVLLLSFTETCRWDIHAVAWLQQCRSWVSGNLTVEPHWRLGAPIPQAQRHWLQLVALHQAG